ncbi:ATP-binding protein [Peribacillus butanolivorans]|uniref:ATP-binding protein n=1 Tax=Peribacillus butanolivorans TaxID=421767 RepID=A0AAX0RQT4_9BACI|nr:AAA family ATPase [Peribacillus butanolivorans]PEJ29306.1 ATP-binding protein [Peribacillus butanolivorans]
MDSLRDERKIEAEIQKNQLRTIYYNAPSFGTSRIRKDIYNIGLRLQLLEEKIMIQAGNDSFQLKTRLKEMVDLVIVDEVDRLKLPGIEVLRELFDDTDIGIVMIGMPRMQRKLSRYPQLYSRIGFSHEYKMLGEDELHFILENRLKEISNYKGMGQFESYEAMRELIRVTRGNFRILDRMLAQIERIMKINQLSSINKEVIDTAKSILVIGK